MPAAAPSPQARVRRALRSARRAVLRRRRWLAAGCAGVAVAAGVQAAAPPPPDTAGVWVATRDLPAGTELAPDDVQHRDLTTEARPDGAVTASPAGSVLASPMRSGEPVTDVRLWGADLLAAYPGRVAVPVRLPDPAAAALLEPGDELDLWATASRGTGSSLVVAGGRVVAIPPEQSSRGAVTGRLVVLAVTPESVAEVQEASARHFLSWSVGPLG